jgi:hypothetical protein
MRQTAVFLWTCMFLWACKQKDKGEIVTVGDGLELPITACVEVHGRAFGKAIDARAFCKCFLPKFYEDTKGNPEMLKLLKEGKWHEINIEQQESAALKFQDCFVAASTGDSTAKFVMSPRMIEKMKVNMKLQLKGSEIDSTNDLDKYCDCLANSFDDFTAKEIVQGDFIETEKFQKIAENCLQSTRKQ